ncbi:hypothetical protein ACOSQ2_028501 [Xanthoceras sorbifolium]
MRIIVQVLAALLTTIPYYVTALASDRRYLPYPLTYTNRLSPSHRSRSRCNPYSVLVFSNSHSDRNRGLNLLAAGKGLKRAKAYFYSKAVSSCCPNTHPIDISATDKYNNKGLPGVGRTSTGGFIRYRLILSNALSKKKPFPLSLKGFSEASTLVISPEITPLPSPRSVSDEFLPKTVSVMVAAADAASTSNFVPPPANNTI